MERWGEGMGRKPVYSIIEIAAMADGTIKQVKSDDGNRINPRDFEFDKANGYPSIEHYQDGVDCSYHTARFIAKYKNSYCLVDTNFTVVIDFCDTIVALFMDGAVVDGYEKCDIIMDLPYEHRYGLNVHYQAIRGQSTFLYNNSGEQVFPHAYTGVINEDLFGSSKRHIFIRDLDFSLSGLMDTTGRVLLPLQFNLLRGFKGGWSLPWSEYFVAHSDTLSGIFNALTEEWIVTERNGFYFQSICVDTYLFRENSKYGVFEIYDGIIIPAKYDTIILPRRREDWCWDENSEPLILKKNKGKKLWRIPRKYFDY